MKEEKDEEENDGNVPVGLISSDPIFFITLFARILADLLLLLKRSVSAALPHRRRGHSPVGTLAMSTGGVEQIQLLKVHKEDPYDGVIVHMDEPMDPEVFAAALRASVSEWRQKGKKGVWIKLPKNVSNLVDPAVKEGFWYHHAEPDYVMLVYWIPTDSPSTLPVNASHRVGVGAFVMNSKREVLVVQEKSGRFRGTGVWKLPTGVVNEGEDICTAVIRERDWTRDRIRGDLGIQAKPQIILQQIRFVFCLHATTKVISYREATC